MSNVYIRSQNREKLYIFGISFNSLQYEEQHDYVMNYNVFNA